MNMGPTPMRASATEQALAEGASAADAAALAAEGTEPSSDLNASVGLPRAPSSSARSSGAGVAGVA